MSRTRRSFTKEFNLEAVRLITKGGQSICQVESDLGIRDTILGRWKKDWEQGRDAVFLGKGQVKLAEASYVTCDRRMSGYGWNGIA